MASLNYKYDMVSLKRTQKEFGIALLRYTVAFKISHHYFTRSEPVKQNQSRKRFPCFASATCIYFEFKLIQWSVSILCMCFARVITLVLITSLDFETLTKLA